MARQPPWAAASAFWLRSESVLAAAPQSEGAQSPCHTVSPWQRRSIPSARKTDMDSNAPVNASEAIRLMDPKGSLGSQPPRSALRSADAAVLCRRRRCGVAPRAPRRRWADFLRPGLLAPPPSIGRFSIWGRGDLQCFCKFRNFQQFVPISVSAVCNVAKQQIAKQHYYSRSVAVRGRKQLSKQSFLMGHHPFSLGASVSILINQSETVRLGHWKGGFQKKQKKEHQN